MNRIAEDILMHYGIKRRSGRYPYGSGKDPHQHGRDFLGRVKDLKKNGWVDNAENVKKEFGLTLAEYRSAYSIANNEQKSLRYARAKALKEDGYGETEIARMMGFKNESSVRSLLNEKSEARRHEAKKTADFIREKVDEKGIVDISGGVEHELGVSRERMKQSVDILKKEGYVVWTGGTAQVNNKGQHTVTSYLCKPGTEHKEIFDLSKVHSLMDYTSHDGGETFDKLAYPKSLDSKRVKIRYKEEGGEERDGLIEIRRGVPDLSLGNERYSQVRILVDDKKYLKGMAVYSDDMPDGVDIVFNTNKKLGTDKMDVMKDIKGDPDNPFGALIKANGQSYYIDADGNRQLSPINKTRSEGDWSEWTNALPSQFLSKQPIKMIEKQLNLSVTDKLNEYEDICNIQNKTIKRHYLEKFAEDCDSTAVHLKAAALPGQKYHVIIPINTLKDTEVYAPNYEPGTKLALIRYPHGGIFEIPVLTVTHKNPLADKMIGKSSGDAIGITKKVADQLSGADFDGDTVMCIPTDDQFGRVKISRMPLLKELRDFDPKLEYGGEIVKDANGQEHAYRNGREYKIIKPGHKQQQMGVASNLINDMTLAGAPWSDIAKAVKHSMVIIDAEKHKLDYSSSERDNDIETLKARYQRQILPDGTIKTGGASTIISRAKSEERVLKRQGQPKVNIKGKDYYDPDRPEGALLYKISDKAIYQAPKTNKRTGETVIETRYRRDASTKMAETDDASTLMSAAAGPKERAYASYANKLKSLANQARKEMVSTGNMKTSDTAKKIYAEEIKSLDNKLKNAELNRPKEREAQRRANLYLDTNFPKTKEEMKELNITGDTIKKAGSVAVNKYRSEVGTVARRDRAIFISDKEWEAIQAGAISDDKLKRMLKYTDVDDLRQRATPKDKKVLSQTKINRIKSLRNSNFSLFEIAKKMGVSTSTVSECLKGGN